MRPVVISTIAATLTAGATAVPAAASPPTAICAAVPDGAALVVANADGVTVERAGGSERIAIPTLPANPTVAARGPDGTLWIETFAAANGDTSAEAPTTVHRVDPDGSAAVEVATGSVALMNAGWLDGHAAAIMLVGGETQSASSEAEDEGSVLVDVVDGEPRHIGPTTGPEFGVGSATLGAGRVVEGAFVDLTESIDVFDATGARLDDWSSPTQGAAYNEPPLYQWPVAGIAPETAAATWSWVEAPDWSMETGQLEGGWSLVVADPVAGAESLRLDLGTPGDGLLHADFDGRFWVGAFADTPDGSADATPFDQPSARVLMVDTAAAEPAMVDAGCTAGTIPTLDRNGTPAPPEVPAPPTTTTVAPTTTAPTTTVARCTYVDADNAYPLRKCDRGPAVRAIQEQINKRGQTIDVDGYFGPGTEQAVRNFQQAAGLEVDGLVGPDTWAALYTGDPAGTDADSNGTIEPWEVGAAEAPSGWVGSTYPYPRFDTSGEGGSAGSAEIGGVPVWAAWSVELDSSPAPYYYAIWATPSNGTATLLLGRSGVDTAADPAATVTIVAAVDVTVVDGTVPAIGCSLDGTADPSVVAAVTVDYSGPTATFPVRSAWRLASGGETIEPIDAARVSCEDGIPIVD